MKTRRIVLLGAAFGVGLAVGYSLNSWQLTRQR